MSQMQPNTLNYKFYQMIEKEIYTLPVPSIIDNKVYITMFARTNAAFRIIVKAPLSPELEDSSGIITRWEFSPVA